MNYELFVSFILGFRYYHSKIYKFTCDFTHLIVSLQTRKPNLRLKTIKGIGLLLVIVLTMTGCSVARFIPEGEHLLNDVKIRTTEKSVATTPLQGYVGQHANSRWFSVLKVPMAPYLMSGRDTTKRINRFLQRIGEAPVIYDRGKAEKTRANIEAAVRNMGYLRANVKLEERIDRFKLNAIYSITPGPRYTVAELEEHIPDTAIQAIVDSVFPQ